MQPFDLRTAVNRQSWAWLLDLPHRLNVAIEIVDERSLPMLPVGSGHTAAALRRLLAAEAAPLRSAISNVTQSSPLAVAVDGELCVCFALAPGGVLILARDVGAGGEPAEKLRQDLEIIGSWLGGAIEASLGSAPNGTGAESHMIASLQRLLSEAMSRGLVRGVVSAFVESLAVWLDIEVHGYVAGAHGRFFRSVSPIGRDQSAMSTDLDDAAAPADMVMVRLSPSEAERLGLASGAGDVLIRRIATQTGASWLMVFKGTINRHDEARLTVYSDLLHEALDDLTAEATASTVAAIMEHLSIANGPVEAKAQSALDQIVTAVGARHGALVVTTAEGTQALAIGNTDLLEESAHCAAPDRLVVQSAHNGELMALAVAGEGGRFTAHERDVLEAAAAVLQPWVRVALQRSGQVERRRGYRPFQAWIDRLASETIQEGGHASVIVISIPDMALRPEFMQAQVVRIKNELRPSDFAGRLTSGEIAVLLRDTQADQAAVVSDRLKKLLQWDVTAGRPIEPSIRMVSCSPESQCEGSIVRAARKNGTAHLQA